ncbi:MAG: YopX family protein [Ruminococcus flavefaciens]|nr:YopX family protein [Ruminococcus flavefaciens]
MEREILFRGKHDPKYGVGWCYGVPYIDNDGDCILATNINRRVVIKETVGQYTGLTDKNGVKIFEGDILEAESGNIGYVMFINGAFMKSCNSKDMPFLIASDVNAVIGNVFDNPELLKGEDLK